MRRLKLNTEDVDYLRTICAGRYAANERQRWDILWAQPMRNRSEFFTRVYRYANDTHIDSALRAVVKPHPSCTCSADQKPAPGVLWHCACATD